MAKVRAEITADRAAEHPGALTSVRRSTRNTNRNQNGGGGNATIKQEKSPTKSPAAPKARRQVEPPTKVVKRSSPSPSALAQVKTEVPSPTEGAEGSKEGRRSKGDIENKEAGLRAKKLKSYSQFSNKSPFPDFQRPTPEECKRVYEILASLHGERQRPEKVVAPANRAGCGDSPSVLDALVRTILSQNTSNKNSTRAKLDMDEVYGSGDSQERWDAIATGGPAKLEKAIARGGLGGVKSRVIIEVLRQVKERYTTYSLDHLLRVESSGNDEEAMRELISFRGVGPKTASCVLLFCVGQDRFAVDTHVHRLTGMLGWRPASASRDETFAHLDIKIPDALKYGLHVLFVEHGRKCSECRAGGRDLGNCLLRMEVKRLKSKGRTNGGHDAQADHVE
ncbi:DNA glycosylase [Hypoxylon sp. NC1633]|nr:DNA glycosylase [Hypoxylon sp. NC1633]